MNKQTHNNNNNNPRKQQQLTNTQKTTTTNRTTKPGKTTATTSHMSIQIVQQCVLRCAYVHQTLQGDGLDICDEFVQEGQLGFQRGELLVG